MRFSTVHLLFVIVLAWASVVPPGSATLVADRALAHEAYVWQRDWNSSVRQAVAEHATHFQRIVVLGAEVTWSGNQPALVRVPIEYEVLGAAKRPVGLALRIGAFPGPFKAEGETMESLCDLAASLLQDAGAHNLIVTELQIDFDCAESKLAGYRTWVDVLRKRISPVPLCITALPAWLGHREFGRLVSAAGSYVLQVHSLERPKDFNARFALCDPRAVLRAVEVAGKLGVPFRVALPTYGYSIAFDRMGKFVGLSAEIAKSWPAGTEIREVRADPGEMAGLVRFWSTNRPPALAGLIWYRLPVATDALNWPWPALAAVMKGQAPRQQLRVEASKPEPRLIQISLINDGQLECPAPPAILVHWRTGRLVAADALHGFELADQGTRLLRFQPSAAVGGPGRLGPGRKCPVGWLRLSSEQEVQIEMVNAQTPNP